MLLTHTNSHKTRTYFVSKVVTIPKRYAANSQVAVRVFPSVLLCSKVKAQEQLKYLQECSIGCSFQIIFNNTRSLTNTALARRTEINSSQPFINSHVGVNTKRIPAMCENSHIVIPDNVHSCITWI